MFNMKKNQNSEISSVFDDVTSFFTSGFPRINQLKTDIVDAEDQFVLFVEIPGIKKENIAIEVDEDYIKISILPCNKEDSRVYIRKERRLDPVSRRFYLGPIEEDDVTAMTAEGILVIKVPKKSKEIATRKLIPIE